jgi:hypothetical protein
MTVEKFLKANLDNDLDLAIFPDGLMNDEVK